MGKTFEMASGQVEGPPGLQLQAINPPHSTFPSGSTHLTASPNHRLLHGHTLIMGMLLSDDPDNSTGKRRDASWLDCQQKTRDALSHMLTNDAARSEEGMAILTSSVRELKGLYGHSFDTWPDDVLVDQPQATAKMKQAFSDLDAKVKTLGTQPSEEATKEVQSAFKTDADA